MNTVTPLAKAEGLEVRNYDANKHEAIDAMRILASGSKGDIPVVSGESGAAGLAGLVHVMRHPELQLETGLGAESRVLLISTEGATAPAVYQELVGKSAEEVLATQAKWLG